MPSRHAIVAGPHTVQGSKKDFRKSLEIDLRTHTRELCCETLNAISNLLHNVFVLICMKLTIDSIGGFPPASSSRTFQFAISLKRAATIEPDDPAPTTMKSYSSRPDFVEEKCW